MQIKPIRRIESVAGAGLLCVSLAIATLAACRAPDRDAPSDSPSEVTVRSPSDAHVVEVIAVDYAFQAPAEIPSGWTTFRMKNEGQEEHFLLLNRLPQGKTFEDYRREVAAPFDSVWYSLNAGSIDQAEAGRRLGSLLPDWYLSSVKQMGGPGLVAPGGISQASARLDPGTYVIECYVKSPDGVFHSSLGMARPLTVTDASSGAPAPHADLEMTLSNYDISIEDEIAPGEHTVAVHFKEHPEVGLGNDVHLVRLGDDADVDEVVEWMGWMNPNGLRAPAPAEFLGGTQEMPAGHTAYFTVDIEPGRYLWISESTAEMGMMKEFRVE